MAKVSLGATEDGPFAEPREGSGRAFGLPNAYQQAIAKVRYFTKVLATQRCLLHSSCLPRSVGYFTVCLFHSDGSLGHRRGVDFMNLAVLAFHDIYAPDTS